MNILRRLVNKKLEKKRYRGTHFNYSLSFENTKLDWYTSTPLNVQAIGTIIDMTFFADMEKIEKQNPLVALYIIHDKDPLITEGDSLLADLENGRNSINHDNSTSKFNVIQKRLLECIKVLNMKDGIEVEIIEESSIPIKSINVKLLAKLISPYESKSFNTYCFGYIIDPNTVLVLRALLPFGEFNKWLISDLDVISKSFS